MLRSFAGAAGLLLLGLSHLAQAQGYGQHTTPIRAGIIVLDSAKTASGQPINSTPFPFYNLDSDLTVKPPSWNIYNPDATTQVSPAVSARWGTIGVDLGFAGPPLGQGLTKATAAYWEVQLDGVGDAQISDYDILLVSAYNFTNLNSMERDKLRKFADQGGVLWIDVSSGTNFVGNEVNTFPLPFETITLGTTALNFADSFSPLTTNPYAISMANLGQIRTDATSFASPLSQNGSSPTSWDIESWLVSDYFMHFDVVAGNGSNPTVLLGKMGSGYVVVTTSGYAAALNRVPVPGGYSANNFFYARTPSYDNTTQIAAKFAVNLISLSSTFNQPGGGPRHGNDILTDIGPPLLLSTQTSDTTVAPNQSPVLYKGLMVVASGSTIKVYDAKPGTDLDGDGNADDGLPDYSLGAGYDELWESTLPTTSISGATCAEVPGSAHKDQIFVEGANGHVYAFDAFNLNANGIIVGSSSVAPLADIAPPTGIANSSFTATDPQAGPYAPTFFDGLLYVSDVQGSPFRTGAVWVADPATETTVKTNGTAEWLLGCNGAQTLPEPTGSPTIGYIPVQDGSGGYDRVMYIPGRPTGVLGPTGTASITSLWMGVRGESPPPQSVVTNQSDGLEVNTRDSATGIEIYLGGGLSFGATANRSLGVKLSLIHPNGNPYTNAEMFSNFAGTVTQPSAGRLVFPWKGAGGTLEPNVGVRLDYSLDWSVGSTNNALTSSIIRGQLYLPDDYADFSTNAPRCILGNIAMSSKGTIYAVSSTQSLATGSANNPKDGGSYYAIREDIGRGGFRLLTRFQLAPRHNIPLNQATPVNYEQTLEDSDPLQNVPGVPSFLVGKDFSHLTFMSPPAVHDGVVYVTALGRKDNGAPFEVPYSILMAFNGEPEPPEIRLSGSLPNGFSFRQYDIDKSGNHVNPTAPDDMSNGQFVYEPDTGIVRFDSLMSTNRGPMVSAFSTSEPVVLRQPNAPDQLIEPDANFNRWTPLLWYSVMHGVEPSIGAPVVTGGSVFVPGKSIIPNLAAYLANGTIQFSGMVEAWTASVSPNDPNIGVFPDGSRPWIKQLFTLSYSGAPPVIKANSDLLWPQLVGVQSFSDFTIRMRQTRLGNPSLNGSQHCFGLAGGNGTLAAWGENGAYAFTKADFMIADEGRLARFDASGNPIWISSSSSSTGNVDSGAVGALKPLVRPVRAYPVGTNDVIVVDPGANRVARLDLSGREIRSITGFQVDPNNIPDGFQANEPLTLNSPRDVQMYTTYNPANQQYFIHYLVADSGNKRLVDIVDQYSYSPATGIVGPSAIGVLDWHSPANFSGKDFDYNSISRVFDPNSGQYFLAAGIGGDLPTRVNTGLDSPSGGISQPIESKSGNGGVVIFDPVDPSKNVVINQIAMPDIAANTYWNFTTGNFNSPFRAAHNKLLSNVTSVTAKTIFDGPNNKVRVALMITDATGVYEIWLQNAANDPTQPWFVRWMMPNQAYQGLRQLGNNPPLAESPLDLRATYARRLDDGDVIVVNGYMGKTRGGNDFLGEVLQIDGDLNSQIGSEGFDFNKPNFGLDLGMIDFELPPILGARGLVLPVFADRR